MSNASFSWLSRRAVVAGCLAYFGILIAGLLIKNLSGQTMIFGSFWESGRAATNGLNPFLNYPLVFVGDARLGIHETNLNPPATLPLFQLFALVSAPIGGALWLLLSTAGHLFCMAALDRLHRLSRVQVAWFLTSPVVIGNFKIGQIYTVLLALSLGIWVMLRAGRSSTAGILLGLLIAIKPNFGLCGLALLLIGQYRTAVIGFLLGGALSLLPALLFGPQVFHQWLEALALDNHQDLFPNEISVVGYLHRAGLDPIALPSAIIIGLWGLFQIHRLRPSPEQAGSFGLWLGIICSPLAWSYYLVVLIPAVTARKWGPMMFMAAALTMVPISFGHAFMGQQIGTVVFGTVYILPAWLMGYAIISEWAKGHRDDSKAVEQSVS